jgi:signal transduction histidine kinase
MVSVIVLWEINMNRLWIRMSLMMSTVLILVFFTQFLSIILEPQPEIQITQGRTNNEHEEPSKQEIANRLVEWMVFSIVVSLAGGLISGRIITVPLRKLVTAANRLGKGERSVRVPESGSNEVIELARTFNRMAMDLEKSEKLRNDLMADVSHELRTPLTVLEGNLRAALDNIYTLDEAEIANLLSQTHHLILLVNDLRELSLAETRQLTLHMQEVDINDLVNEIHQALEPLAGEKEVSLENVITQSLEIRADPARIRQVLFNLLFNSIRHTPAGGKITIFGRQDLDQIVIQVRDNGDGLDADQLNSVFNRFYRGDKSRSRDTGGTGLGLAIVKAIIETHGGHVNVESPGKGKGSTFTIFLPLVKTQLQPYVTGGIGNNTF